MEKKLNLFCQNLAERFPWKDMENEVTEETFKNVAYVHDEFWTNLNSTLESHKEREPIRCLEVIDFVGKCANFRKKNDATMAHFKNPVLAEMVLPYFSEAVRQKCQLSVTQLFILLDISFEHPKLALSVSGLMFHTSPQQIVVRDEKYEKALISAYYYLYNKEVTIKKLLHDLNLR